MQHRAVGTVLLLVLLHVKELVYSSRSLLQLLEGLVTATIQLSSCAMEACLLVVQWWWNIITIKKKRTEKKIQKWSYVQISLFSCPTILLVLLQVLQNGDSDAIRVTRVTRPSLI